MLWPTPHIRAWYAYAFASDMYASAGVGMFMPIALEKMSRTIGFWAPDLTVPCTTPLDLPDGTRGVCKALIFGYWIETNTFSLWVKSLSVFIQVFVIISIGPFADDLFWRKRFLICCALFGASMTSTFLFFPSATPTWVPVASGLLNIIGYNAYAVSIVCANAFLPTLAAEDVQAQSLKATEDDEDRPLLEDTKTVVSLATSRLSSVFFGIGCFSAFLGVGPMLVTLTLLKGSNHAFQLILGATGVIWGLFTIPAFALPGGVRDRRKVSWTVGWRRISALVVPKGIRRLPNIFRFIIAWSFLADAFHTLSITMLLYASSQLGVPSNQLIVIFSYMVAILGLSTGFAPSIQRAAGISNRAVMIIATLIGVTIPLWASLGLFFPWAGLRTPSSVYLTLVIGIGYGPFFSYARAVFAEMIPAGHESTFFSLFALSDKSASFAGPLLVGLITQLTGELMYAFVLIVAMMLLPVPLLLWVDVAEGHEQAKRWVEGEAEDQEGLMGTDALPEVLMAQ